MYDKAPIPLALQHGLRSRVSLKGNVLGVFRAGPLPCCVMPCLRLESTKCLLETPDDTVPNTCLVFQPTETWFAIAWLLVRPRMAML